ncbi:ABC transporter substrate-binding protein [Chlorobiota bacterium]|nr:ABC transporter substrate-binding protein [Chlorobiota bacterium]
MKSTLATLFSLLSIFFITSCSSRQENDNTSLTFGCFLNSPKYQKELQALLQEFEKNEGIKVEMIGLNWSDGKTKLISAYNAGTQPDIVELGSDWVAQFSGGGVLEPLSRDEIQTKRFLENALAPSKWGDSMYAVPWVLSTRILFINRQLCKKAGIADSTVPNTISDLKQYASAITNVASAGEYGIGIISQDAHQVYKRVLPIFWSNSGDILDKKGNPTFDLPQNIDALQQYVSLVPFGIIESSKQLDDKFIKGKLGFWVSGPWLLEKIPQLNPNLQFSLGLVPGIHSGGGLSFTGGDYLCISKSSKNRAKSLKLIQFLTSSKSTLRLCKLSITAGIPADTSAQSDPFFSSINGFPVFIEQLKKSRLSSVHPKWLDIEAAYELAVSQAVYGTKSATEALHEAQTSVTSLLLH